MLFSVFHLLPPQEGVSGCRVPAPSGGGTPSGWLWFHTLEPPLWLLFFSSSFTSSSAAALLDALFLVSHFLSPVYSLSGCRVPAPSGGGTPSGWLWFYTLGSLLYFLFYSLLL